MRGWVDRRIAVVAVAIVGDFEACWQVAEATRRRTREGVAVCVGVEGGLGRFVDARVSVVDSAVAVFVGVGEVADLLRGWVDAAVVVVAVGVVHRVGRRQIAEAFRCTSAVVVVVAVEVEVGLACIGRARIVVVGESVAVFVGVAGVADFRRAWVDRAVPVIAVGVVHRVGRGQVAETLSRTSAVVVVVAVEVEVALASISRARIVVVRERVAVFVSIAGVADFGRARIDRGVEVVAIGVVHRVASGEVAEEHRCTSAVGVEIRVDVEVRLAQGGRAWVIVVGERIAVLVGVERVADFLRARIDGGVPVVAVGVVGHTANGLDAREHARTCAKEVAVGVDIEQGRVNGFEIAVGLAVAVVVYAVVGAVFHRTWVDRGVAVVAVTIVGDLESNRQIAEASRRRTREGVEIGVGVEGGPASVGCARVVVVGERVAVFVGVELVADFGRAWVDGGVAVVAVGVVHRVGRGQVAEAFRWTSA